MGATRTCSSCGDKLTDTLDRCPRDGTALFSDEVMARVGRLLKDHEILAVLGEGGMGAVYRARHVVIEKPVAIKILNDSFARQKDMVEQFIVEAKAASRIRHPNIIDVTDFGTTPEGLVFLIMEYLEGQSLEERLRKVGRLPAFEAINIVKQVARGLGAAHELGIVHRDLKPANIFLCQREGRRRIVRRTGGVGKAQFTVEPEASYDFVKLLDFGVAKFLDRGPGSVTRAGMLVGSPYYLSPEQAQEKPATERSDIYALGATFYEMVTGAVPFDGTSVLEVLNGHVWGDVIPPSRRAPEAGIDARLDAVILKCLEKNPEHRFATAEEIRDALRECVTDRAFLRDAHRLPGIRESGFDLSQATASARAAVAVPEQGFSAVESDREAAEAPDERPTGGGRQRLPGNTMRIPRERSSQVILWTLLALLVLAAASALWALRAADRPATMAVVAVPPASKPKVALVPGPAVVPTAPPAPPAPAPAVVPAPAPEPAATAAPVPQPVPSPPGATAMPGGLGSGTASAASAPPPAARAPAERAAAPALGADKTASTRTRSGGASRTGPVAELPTLPPQPAVATPLPAPAPPEPAPTPPATTPAADVAALLREAQEAWTKRYYAVAIDKAREVLKADPKRQTAHQIIAICSCAIGNADDARAAVSHLDEHNHKLVRSLCQRHGVTLE